MSKKTYIVIGVLSVVIWYISRIVQALVDIIFFDRLSVSFFPSSNVETGYPIALNLNSYNEIYYIYFIINISFWFVLLLGVRKLIKRTFGSK
ncbi:hypothetical protein CO051_03535 [Candidatus Roizmanbacteria bacterium CG_4_9_14_0_2_um_filter_39_13]|uniref:Uncharacterized protein n=1 Tax=Candidatus Roizmanbacteria bacterium CG_4_9_14_0_2_um_filter_39_13 TaxID=1974839 RepID=A0A2M8EZ28_9BACT|nr:MAG: hypothetical protein COY15_00955 [Candidatus Roizmanbacteria bacterium CG_4_10_14_0_2_um_filter_39_12]PJC31993.1 MAG: hypothetical protein CO051_03535 [Candidatus Roizmanbacteria bacterium CG_4_9_14_0_2_um_filter_39_13]